MLKNYSFKDFLKELHERFIVTPIDKTVRNTVVICFVFFWIYITGIKELRFSGNHAGTPKLYETCGDKANDQVINNHGNTFVTFFISLNTEKSKCLISLLAD